MLKNMKIKKSLILGFGITIVVSLLIIISTLGLLFNQKNAYTSVIETEMRANELIISIRLDATVAARCVRDMALNPDDRSGNAELESYINSTLNGLDAKIKELREIYPLDDRDLDTLIQDLEVWAEQVPDIIHRISVMSSGGLDSLPHSSGTASALGVAQLTHKEGYMHVFWLNTVIPMIVTAIACVLASMGVC